MKILCIADIHGELESILKVGMFAKERGIRDIIILGDFTKSGKFRDVNRNLGDAEYVFITLDSFDFNILAIPGNCDSKEILKLFNEFNSNLHEKVKEICGIAFIGLGGSNPTPFNTPFEFNEQEIYNKLKEIMEKCADNKNKILITHCPPKDTKCDYTGSGHVGSGSLRKIVEEFQPGLVVCSHIHECGGETDKIGETKIANIGMLGSMRCGIIDTGTLDIGLMRME
ncbi:hypothetical protein BEH94_09550 [Candidatus Altiarchaeales archaeon WOR_SM1_SCG]|nr:hypothetical protein BEH94_09550 [Candidatus Altiarchaeales archaeon WOR_SM1_SCG]